MKSKLTALVFLLLFLSTSAQERLTGLVTNPLVKSAIKQYKTSFSIQQAVGLPFFDDFSSPSGVLPNQGLWKDNYVFINDNYPVNPPTIGVATFDAIDNKGRLYPQASPFPFGADSLTSVEIRLDSILTPVPRVMRTSDSLYFSFFYQPQGNGNVPSRNDSLVLQFLAPDETLINYIPADTVLTGNDTVFIPADTIITESWVRVWGSGGSSLQTFNTLENKWFKQVIVPILDSARFYKPNFRFRFINFASLSNSSLPDWQANGDHWNIDYVYLNTGRTINDTTHPDVAFASKAPSMLRTYTSMPFDQYRQNFANEMKDAISMNITNLDDISYNTSYRYQVSGITQAYNGGNFYIAPYITNGYSTHQPFAKPVVNFVFPLSSPREVTYTITHVLNTEANLGRRQNDTTRYNQVFSNYLAYDDGTAEVGYGITPTGAQVAYKFKLNKSDSLYGVYMYFNQTLTQGNVQSFYLNVWNDYFGQPGDVIYSRFGYTPLYSDDLNKYSYYELDSAIMIQPGVFPNNIFYVGWVQASDENLNLGYDMNNNASANTFVRTFDGWSQSQYTGAMMIRPVIGTEQVLSDNKKEKENHFIIYPNPASNGLVRIKSGIDQSKQKDYSLLITTSDGRKVAELPISEQIDISRFISGIYFIHMLDRGRIVASEKLIINR